MFAVKVTNQNNGVKRRKNSVEISGAECSCRWKVGGNEQYCTAVVWLLFVPKVYNSNMGVFLIGWKKSYFYAAV